jgi:Ca-activated chloride channel family protein
MRFARIEMLFLIWAAPALALALIYGMRRRRKALSRFASGNGLPVMAPSVSSGRRWAKGGLTLAALVFTAIALSGPQYGFRWREIERRGVDLIIALDCSRSMLAQDLQPTRLDRAKREVQDLLAMLKGDRVGLAAFSGTAFLQCPLTLDYAAFNLFLDILSPDYLPVGGTDITGALTVAGDSFDPKSPAEKAVILITDGENTGNGDPIEAAGALEKRGVKLFCIGVGGEEGAPIPNAEGGFKKDREGRIVMTRLDEETLKKMAVLTGGTYVRSVAGDMDLDVLYGEEIRGKMETAALSGGRKQVWEDRFQWFLGLAIFCLVIELFLRPVRRTADAALVGLSLVCFLGCLNPFPAQAGPLEEGLQAYDQGDYEAALKRFIDAQLDAPDRADILYNIGNAYYKLGDYEAALTHYRQALEKNPPDLAEKAHYNKGNAHFKAHDYEAAVKAYQAALEIDPNDRQADENLQFVRKVMEQQQQQRQPSQNGRDGDENDAGQDPHQEQNAGDAGKDPASKEDQTAKPPENQNGDAPQSTPQPQPTGEDNQEDVQDASPAAAQAAQPEDGNREGAKRALNRLKDQPGKALMAPPAYGLPEVEKDW